MKKTDIAHDTNLPYFLQRHPNGWAFYNRAYRNTMTGIDQGADKDPATVEIPTHVLAKLNGGGQTGNQGILMAYVAGEFHPANNACFCGVF